MSLFSGMGFSKSSQRHQHSGQLACFSVAWVVWETKSILEGIGHETPFRTSENLTWKISTFLER